MSANDMWDDAGPFEYRILPETSLAAFFTEERDMLTITPESGRFWLGETGVAGQSPYDTLADAKAAGDERIAELDGSQDAALLQEAGLAEDLWRVSYRDGLRFERLDGSIEIFANEQAPRQSWDVFAKTDDPIATGLQSVADALAALGVLEPA